ncbi:MAG TPA: hypothetical protein VGR26_19165 [Acidimicrobiales bacterium]|nr:hypothetical protein [Acidimicrobiales bacterium]
MSTRPALTKARVYADPYDVDVHLARLGLPKPLLLQAAEDGHVDRVFASPLDFPGRGEYDAASRALRTICEEGGKLAAAWHRATYLGIPVAFNLDETVAITVTGGDEFTGINGERDPKTRSLKGPNTRTAATRQTLPLLRGSDQNDHGASLWFMLTYVDVECVRVEIATPFLLESDGRVAGWLERILLGKLDLDGIGRRVVPTAPTPPLEITPVRKTG